MEHKTTVEDYSLDQYMRDSIALRKKLGFVGKSMTPEQERIYGEAQREMWLEKHPNAVGGGPPRPKPKE